MPLTTVRLLGPPEVLLDGAPVPPPLRWRKHLGLCILLWSSAKHGMERSRALNLLWGDRPESDARHSLNEALRQVRRAVGADAITTTGDLVAWSGELELDVTEFLRVAAAEPHRAAAMVRGQWCEAFSVPDAPEFDRWLEDQRRDWRHRLVELLCRAAREAGDRAALAEALEASARARELDPLSEPAARTRAEALAWAGDQSGAIRELDAFRCQLGEELGVVPSRELQELRQALAAGRSRRRQGDPPPPPETPLVGRGDQLGAMLASCRAAVTRKRSMLLVIDGEAGSGRTRLLEELILRSAVLGWTLAMVRSLPGDRSTAGNGLHAIAGAGLWTAPGVAAVAPAALAVLAAEVPAWGEQFADLPGEAPLALADALSAVLRGTAAERPVLVAVDDAEWLDPASLAAIPQILRSCADLPVLMVAVVRSGSQGSGADELRRYVDRPDRGTIVGVPSLTETDLTEAVHATLPGWPADAARRLGRRLLVDSAGLPAIAIGVLAAVARGMPLEETAAPWPPAGRTYDSTIPGALPDPLLAATRMRFNLLPPAARHLLALVALNEAPLLPDRLETLHEGSVGELPDLLDLLEGERWVVSDARGYRLRAPAVGLLIGADMLTPGQRRRLMEQLGAN